MSAQRRKLHMGLRKTINLFRRFKVEHLGEGIIRWTCTTCEHSTTKGSQLPDGSELNPVMAEKLARYASANGGTGTGVCDYCTRVERDKRYPLK